MTAADMSSFRKLWYGVTDGERLIARAVVDYNLGIAITDMEDVQEGDPLQFWRRSGSGHSVLFVNWIRDEGATILGLRYWSAQSSTNGIGYGAEYFGETSGINRDRFYPARLRKPRDRTDFEWSLGKTDTRSQPTIIVAPSSMGWYFY